MRRFLGLASYHRKYIDKFANIAAPLHQLTQKDTPFQWTQKSEESFQRLKACLTEAPVLAYPWFVKHAGTMVLQTDSSNVGLGVVLEQVHVQRVFGYASHTLTKAEANYSVIHLAIVWAMKQFRHYLLGRTFQLMTDHAPLQWLGEQKMEGLLCAGLWQYRSSALKLCTGRERPTEMLTHCREGEDQTGKHSMQP